MTTMAPDIPRGGSKALWPPVLHRIVKTIRTRELFERGQHLLIAVSGGPDSTALLSLLHKLRSSWCLSLTAVHCNYGLRGAESDDDQAFVESLCQQWEIPLHVRRIEMRKHRASLQASARDLRYTVMTEIAETCGADRIAVGHTADDQAETVLLWMLRGAGLTGLSGMPACRNHLIIRPLYETRRRDILVYLHEEGVSFRQDSSNAKSLYLRNRVRHEVMPALQRVVPSTVEVLCRLADICREDDRYLEEQTALQCEGWIRQRPGRGWSIDRSFLQRLPRAAQRRIVRNLGKQSDPQHRPPSIRTVERVLQIVAGKAVASDIAGPLGRITVDQECVQFSPLDQQPPSRNRPGQAMPVVLTIPGEVLWEETGQRIHTCRMTRDSIRRLAWDRNTIVVDAGRISEPLAVRAWEPGDRFYPSGMKGRSKKLQDFYTDLKVSGEDRRRIPVIVAPEGIVWVAGYRQDSRWSVSEGTERYIVITMEDLCAVKGH